MIFEIKPTLALIVVMIGIYGTIHALTLDEIKSIKSILIFILSLVLIGIGGYYYWYFISTQVPVIK